MNDKQVDVKGFFMSRHFYDGIKALSPEQVEDLLLALYADMGCGEMPQLDPITNMVLTMMLPHIHEIQNNALKRKVANQENGKLGGRPRKNQESEENQEDVENEKTQKTIGFLENQQKPLGSEKPHTYIHTDNIFSTSKEVLVDNGVADPEQYSLVEGLEKSKKAPIPDCPHEKIIELYHKCLPELRRVKTWNAKRSKHLKSRWRENWEKYTFKGTQAPSVEGGLDYWKMLFEWIHKMDFLMGRINSFQADLEWIICPTNFTKIIEGKYKNKEAA